jgi:hypothetical protein
MSITVYVTWIVNGIEDDTEVHEFDDSDEYEWFSEMHWRGTSTTSPELFEQMNLEEKLLVDALWEEIED